MSSTEYNKHAEANISAITSKNNSSSDNKSENGDILETTLDAQYEKKSTWKRVVDSCRRMEEEEIDPSLNAEERAEYIKHKIEGEKLNKAISRRHMILISMATGIGTGLLVGTGSALHKGGPAGLIIGYLVVGSMLTSVMEAAGEMAVTYGDLTGGFNAYAAILVDKSFAFSVSWNYCIQWLCVMPLELVTAAMTIEYWTDINSDAFVAIFYTLIVVINFCGSAGYGEAEFFFNSAKVLMIAGFIILSIIIAVGGAGDQGYLGAHYWHVPGAFAHSFKGVCSVFVSAAFSLSGTELLAFTASEQSNARRAIPSATKQVVYRLVMLYIIPLFLITLLVPYDSEDLLGNTGSKTHSSPFVIAVSSVNVVPHIVNTVILLAVLSVGNSALFTASRTLQALAEQGFAPQWFNYIDRTGKPLRGLIVSAIIGIFSFIAAYDKQETVFNWLLSISGLSALLSWSSIVLSHIRFREAMKVQGHSTDELGYLSKVGVWGSWYAFIINILILIAQFWIALFPVGSADADANNFFQNYLGMIVAIVFYLGHKVYHKNWRFYIPAEEIDLIKGRKIFDADILAQENALENERIKNSPFYYRWFKFWC